MESGNAGLPASRLAGLAVALLENKIILLAQRLANPWHQVLARRVVEVRDPIARRDLHLPRDLVVDVGMGWTIGHRPEPGRRTCEIVEQARDRVIGRLWGN